jgi:hypothetical protein
MKWLLVVLVAYILTFIGFGEHYYCINKTPGNFYVIQEVLDGRYREAIAEKQIASVHLRDKIANLKTEKAQQLEKAHLRLRHLKVLSDTLELPGFKMPPPELVTSVMDATGLGVAEQQVASKLAATLRDYKLHLENPVAVIDVHVRMRVGINSNTCLGGSIEITERGSTDTIVEPVQLCEIVDNVPNGPAPKAILARLATEMQQIEDASKNESQRIQDNIAHVELELLTPPPNALTRWDFWYFSLITQATVGYGDILPSTTRVRRAVMWQVVLGALELTLIGIALAKMIDSLLRTRCNVPDESG